jgi:AraC family transcriptional regulator, regulatory protein of adaptative response / methylated-DNA-[protein]-cysteine methyltransferase
VQLSRRCVVQTIESPIGPLITAATADGVCFLEFSGPQRLEVQLAALRRHITAEPVHGMNGHLERLHVELADYFAGRLTRFTVPLLTPGTPFQEKVWAELLRIPYGETRSYEEIACAVSSITAQRAVGRANGTNRIAIVVPCHRVVNKDGKLGGYGGELWRKEMLLGLERTGTLTPVRRVAAQTPLCQE